ncbi:MAG: insulinase family protein [Deltaproteobacteria bacterium]|nr:insulinase family protein [Deltaproteobacteria bacterium]
MTALLRLLVLVALLGAQLATCACGAPRSGAAGGAVAVPVFMKRRPPLGPARALPFPVATVTRLENGLQVWMLPKRDLPILRLGALVLRGASSDPPQRVGLAYATAELLESGAGARDALSFAAELEQMGASIYSSADWDSMLVSIQALSRHEEQVLALLADVVRRPRLEAEEFVRLGTQLRARGEQRRTRADRVAALALRRSLYGEHPYARPLLPTPTEVDRLTVEDVRRFYRQHVRPENVVLVAVGDVVPERLLRNLRARFGDWKGSEEKPEERASGEPEARELDAARVGPRRSPRLVLVRRRGASQSVIRVGHLLPPRAATSEAAVRLIGTILGGCFTSRLNENLRERHGFTYGAHAVFDQPRGPGQFYAEAQVATKDTLAALDQLLYELERLRSTDVPPAELRKGRRLVVEKLPARAETVAGLLNAAVELATHGRPADALGRLPEQVARLDARGLRRAAASLLRPADATIVVVGDTDRLAAALVARFGPAEWLTVDGEAIAAR